MKTKTISIPYGRQHITQKDIDGVVRTLQSDYLTQGPQIVEFEQQFAAYIGCKYAVAVANGTAALHLCAMALNVEKGTKVLTTPITFAASANCVRYCGGDVVFADIDPNTLLLDINKVELLLKKDKKSKIKGIIPVDFAGFPVNLEEYRYLADKYGCWIIEDACHAPGGYFIDKNGEKQNCGNGKFSDMAIFSFHPVKHIATGEGGMITTNRKDLYDKLLLLRTHGITKNPALLQENHGGWYYEMHALGYNYRLPDILAALGSSQLESADAGLDKRRRIAQKYDAAFKNTFVRTLPTVGGHAYHLYIIQVDNRLGLYNYLRDHHIYAQVHYIPVHTLPYYRSLSPRKENLQIAENYYQHCLSLPMYPSLTDDEQDYVIDCVLNFVNQ